MRIVTHTCSNTEIVCALGAGQHIVGVDDHSDYPAEIVSRVSRIGPDLDIDIERIKALKPDWVITSLTVPGHEKCLERIKDAGLRYIVTQPTSLKEVMADFSRIGEALGKQLEARRWISAFESRLEAPRLSHEPVPIVIEWWPKPVIVPGRDSWVNEMLSIAGGINPFGDEPKESFELDGARAERANVQGVIMSWCGVSEDKYRPHIVTRRPDWARVPAVQNHHIYPIGEAWLGRPGPRLLEGIDKLSHVVRQIRNITV